MCEYEYEYLIITWVRVRVRVLVDEYEYKYEYRSMINILYRQQIFVVRSVARESSDSKKPGTKFQLPIVHVNDLCQYISVWLFYVIWYNDSSTYVLRRIGCRGYINNLLPVQKQKAKIVQYHEVCGKQCIFSSLK